MTTTETIETPAHLALADKIRQLADLVEANPALINEDGLLDHTTVDLNIHRTAARWWEMRDVLEGLGEVVVRLDAWGPSVTLKVGDGVGVRLLGSVSMYDTDTPVLKERPR